MSWPIQTALSSVYIDVVLCSTDDPEIAQTARSAGALVPFIRPPHLATDTASSIDVVIHALDAAASELGSFEYVAILEPTSPLTESHDVDAALELLNSHRLRADSVVGVSECGAVHPAFCVSLNGEGLVEFGQPGGQLAATRRQEVPPMFFFDGSLYVSDVETLRERGSFVHDRTMAFEMPRWQSLEIDDPLDLVLVEAVMARREDFREQS